MVRRFNHPEWQNPDLIIVDGGRAQLNATKSIVNNMPVIAITKNEKHIGEKIYMTNKPDAAPLSKLPVHIKNLLLQIDSEAHRFAVSYYRKLHERKALRPY